MEHSEKFLNNPAYAAALEAGLTEFYEKKISNTAYWGSTMTDEELITKVNETFIIPYNLTFQEYSTDHALMQEAVKSKLNITNIFNADPPPAPPNP